MVELAAIATVAAAVKRSGTAAAVVVVTPTAQRHAPPTALLGLSNSLTTNPGPPTRAQAMKRPQPAWRARTLPRPTLRRRAKTRATLCACNGPTEVPLPTYHSHTNARGLVIRYAVLEYVITDADTQCPRANSTTAVRSGIAQTPTAYCTETSIKPPSPEPVVETPL